MGIRRKARELVLQALFQGEFLKIPAQEKFSLLVDNFQVNQKALPYSRELLAGICKNIEEVDGIIKTHAANWRLDRMSVVDRNIIRMASYEMTFTDIPANVSINEAIEIAKKYSTDEASSFINGVLDAIKRARSNK